MQAFCSCSTLGNSAHLWWWATEWREKHIRVIVTHECESFFLFRPAELALSKTHQSLLWLIAQLPILCLSSDSIRRPVVMGGTSCKSTSNSNKWVESNARGESNGNLYSRVITIAILGLDNAGKVGQFSDRNLLFSLHRQNHHCSSPWER